MIISLPLGIFLGMAKVTGKLQITLPKRLAEEHGIRVGDEISLESAGDRILIAPSRSRRPTTSLKERLESFDEATLRHQARGLSSGEAQPSDDRGWTRDELYNRARPR